eukprot:5925358-Pyramimonas_sp.AAC.1
MSKEGGGGEDPDSSDESDRGLGQGHHRAGTAPCVPAPPPPPPKTTDQLDALMTQNGKYWNVCNYEGKPIGQIRERTGNTRQYTVAAVCYHKGHKDCSRMRSWKGAAIEEAVDADRALI